MALFFDKNVTFASLPLDRRVFKALARQHLVFPSLIQARVLPLALQAKDLLITARTGSGKTLAYCVPIIETLLARTENERNSKSEVRGIRTIILLPTRELCVQVKLVMESLLYYCQSLLSLLVLTNESPIPAQIQQLRDNPQIVIATPSRLMQLINTGIIQSLPQSLVSLVLDECDLLLSYDYEDDILTLLSHLTASNDSHYQTLLLSATVSSTIEKLTAKLNLRNPVKIELDESSIPQSLQQYYINTATEDKFLLAYSLIKLKLIQGKTLFFVNDITSAFRLKLFLEQFSIVAAVLNETLPYNSRLSILMQFNRGQFDYLIATDRATIKPNQSIDGAGEGDDSTSVSEIVKVEELIKEEEAEGKEYCNDADGSDSGDVEVLNATLAEPKHKPADAETTTADASDDDELAVKDEPVDESESPATTVATTSRPRAPRGLKRSREFGVSRGIDFQDVVTVVNYDFPLTVHSYIHRVGRTARAGKAGTALSFVTGEDEASLAALLQHQLEAQSKTVINPQAPLTRLNFSASDIEGFRYRVDDVSRAVTGAAVREARLKDLKQELLNSSKLKAHFEDNPREMNLLRHDRVLRPAKIQKHLSHVPEYLIPQGFNEDDVNDTGKKRKMTGGSAEAKKKKKKFVARGKKQKQDPLRSFQYSKGGDKGASGSGRLTSRASKSSAEL